MGARIADRALTVGAALGALGLVVLLAGMATGTRPVALRSGSMAPTMPTGTLALAHQVPAGGLRVGDVVMVRTESGARVTHRITAIDRAPTSTAILTLRGDANDVDDPSPYAVTSAYRVFAHVPYAGYALGGVTSQWGLFVLGGLAMVVLRLLVRGSGSTPGAGGPGSGIRTGRRTGRAGRRTAAVGSVAAFLLLGPGQPGVWAASWTNDAVVSGTTLTAGTIPAPASFNCGGLGILSVGFNWSSVPGATNYTLHYGNNGNSTTTVGGTSATIVSAISGGTAWVEANRSFGATTWTSTASQTRTYTVAVISLCS